MLGKRSLVGGHTRSSPNQYQPLQQNPRQTSHDQDDATTDPSPASTPFGSRSSTPSEEISPQAKSEPTPLPYPTIYALCMGRFAEGLMFGVILPYINEMVHGMGVKEEDLGKWSAAAEAVMFASGAVFAPFTAFLGDRYGRRWVYLIGLALWGVGSIMFGLQKTLPGVILTRSLVGIIAGPSLMSRTIMGEITDKTNSVEGFAIFSPANALGNTVGPVLGGILANPVPSILSSAWTIFVTYPYLLPSVAVSVFSWLVVIFAARYVPETNPRFKHIREGEQRSGGDVEMPLLSPSLKPDAEREEHGEGTQDDAFPRGDQQSAFTKIQTLLRHKPFLFILSLFALVNPVTTAFDVVFPLFAYTPLELGGMGLSVRTTGQVLGLSLVVGIPLNIFLLPPIVKRLGRRGAILLGLASYSSSVLLFPLMHHSHAATSPPGTWTFSTVALLTVYSLTRRIGDFTQTMLDALLLPSIPRAEDLATAASITFSIRASLHHPLSYQFSRAAGIYAVSFVFSLSASAAADSWMRQVWWIAFLVGSFPAVWVTLSIGKELIDDA